MRIRLLMVIALAFTVLTSAYSVPSNADTPLVIKITKAGDGSSTYSSSLTMQVKVSGGSSTKYSTCDAFFRDNQDIRLNLTAGVKEGRTYGIISQYGVKTLEITPTALACEFALVPISYFNFASNMIELPINLTLKISNESTVFDQKTIKMIDESTVQPTLTITSPLRGSTVSGDFVVTTSTANISLWNPKTTSAGAVIGAVSNCVGGVQISTLNSPFRTVAAENQYRSSNKQLVVTQLSANTFRYQFFEPGQYTICISQTFTSISDSNFQSNNGNWSSAAVVVNVSSAVSSLTYSYDDPIFRKIGGYPYNFIFNCPSNVSLTSNTYECSVQAKSKLTSSDLSNLGLTSGTKVNMTGSIPLIVCEFNRDDIRIACQNDGSLVPGYFARVYIVNVGFDAPVKFTVNNYLSKTGYTGVEIFGNIEQGDPDSSFAWKMNNYDANKRKAANAPPSASYQASIAKAIKSAMSSKCQKLPSGFSNYSVKYSKKITSYDGVPGYIFIVNGKTNLQIFEMGNSWQFGPSAATSDQKTWRSWGCGSAIWIY